MTDPPSLPALPAAERWAELLAGWAIPEPILAGASESPWGHVPGRFDFDEDLVVDDLAARWAREVLPPSGGTVLDVGCGGGRASLPLAPLASEITGVDRDQAMLDRFAAAATRLGVARRTLLGDWPDVAPLAPVADVVVCQHVVYDVADIVPFVAALTDRARLAVVVELPTVHPMAAWSEAWHHFWGVERPTGPDANDLVAVLRELGLDPELGTEPRPTRPLPTAPDGSGLARVARRRLCLPRDREAEVATWLAAHPPAWADTMMTVRWPGAAEHVE